MTDICPECSGPRLAAHPAGPVVYSHGARCSVGSSEDARKVADADTLPARGAWARPITAAERLLIEAAGADPDAVDALTETVVSRVAGHAVIARRWFDTTGAPIDPDRTPTTEETTS